MSDSPPPVFLVGAARSGTSLIYRLMALHPQASYLSNWLQRYPTRPRLAALNRVARVAPKVRARAWFGPSGDNAYVYARRRGAWERAFPNPAEAEGFFTACGVSEPGVGAPPDAPDAAQRLRRALATVSRADGNRPVLSKRIAHNRRMPLLAAAFPAARFIEIIRDGRAVAVSLRTVDWWEPHTVWWYGGTPADWVADGGDPWELAGRNWVEEVLAVQAGKEALDPATVLSVKYEELVEAPMDVLARIMAHAGLDPADRHWQEAMRSVRLPNKNERWREELTAEDLKRIESVQSGQLDFYGYDT